MNLKAIYILSENAKGPDFNFAYLKFISNQSKNIEPILIRQNYTRNNYLSFLDEYLLSNLQPSKNEEPLIYFAFKDYKGYIDNNA